MTESVPPWAIDSLRDRMNALSDKIEPEVMRGDESTCLEKLRDEYESHNMRLKQLLADTDKIDVFQEFHALCTQVSAEMKASWDSILESETKLTAMAATVALSAAMLQAIVVGMVISVIGTTVVRSKRYLLPSEKVVSQRDSHAYRVKLLSEALAMQTDIRYPALAIEQLGLQKYQTLMDRGQKAIKRSWEL